MLEGAFSGRRGEKQADRGPREEGTGGVLGCTLRMPDDRERRDATLIATALVLGEEDQRRAAPPIPLGEGDQVQMG